MALKPTVHLTLAGDSTRLTKVFAGVGADAKAMADDVDKASKNMAVSTSKASTDIGGAVDASEGKFRGLSDSITGSADVMEGFRTGNVALMATGMADLAGAMTALVIPALVGLRTTLLTSVVPAMWAVVTHPLFLAFAAGAAIIAGLILVEEKFGLVTKAVDTVKGAATGLWDFFKTLPDLLASVGTKIFDALTWPFRTAFNFIVKAWNATIGGLNVSIPDIPGLPGRGPKLGFPKLKEFHTGGVVGGNAGGNILAVLQAGETIIPRGQQRREATVVVNVSGVGMGRDFGNAVAQALRDNQLIGVT